MEQTLYLVLLLIALCAVSECVQRQYHFINVLKTWTEAQRYCRENYTDLATADTMNDMNELRKNVTDEGVLLFWIGLQKTSVNKWQWSSGDPALYLNWGSGQPDGTDECAFMRNGQWNDCPCSNNLMFICNSSNNNKLILIKEKRTWPEALRYCRQNHVDLVSVHSDEMQRDVMNCVVKRASTAAVWLGLHNYCIMNMWLWLSGENMSYQNWAPGNGTTPENCSLERRKGAVQSGGDQRWVSLPESHKLNFICTNE
ncbi:macrophage mannose receptor 1-like isoform X2 [Pseudorasbora parva]|uniref:macrophage mannose receptor 1-like isoform X2 n=1 Tax=Pseudorasbora parva TaxID=51549 RepID=UPI00351E0B55